MICFADCEGLHGVCRGLHVTTHFSLKLFQSPHLDDTHTSKKLVWSTRAVEDQSFDDENYCFFAGDKLFIILSEDGNSFEIKSDVDPEVKVDLKFTRLVPGFKIGKDGRTVYGVDEDKPWGFIRHVFWPRCAVEGSVIVKDERWWTKETKGKGLMVMAMQAMKPHHAGKFAICGKCGAGP